MRAFWTVSGSILFAGTVGWGGYNIAALLGHEEYREEVTYDAADVRSIDVDNDAGGVTVTGTDAATESGEIRLVARVSDGVRSTENRHSIVDGVLVVRASCPTFGSLWCNASYTIEAPHDIAVKLRADNDSIRVSNLSGSVDAVADNGTITLAGLSGTVDAGSDNGDVDAERLSGSISRFETDNGDVRVQFDIAPLSVTAQTDNGSITVEVPRSESYDVRTATDNGSTSVDVTDDPNSDRVIDATTDNGSITVRYGG